MREVEGGNNDRDIYLTILFDVSWDCWRCDWQVYSWWCLTLSPASTKGWFAGSREDIIRGMPVLAPLYVLNCFRLFSQFLSLAPFSPFSLSLNIRGRSPVAESATSNCNNLIRSRSYTYLGHFLQPDFFCSSTFVMPYFCRLFVSSHYF